MIEETLVTFTEGTNPSIQELTTSLGEPIPTTLDLFRRHQLARWVETEFGVEPEADGRLRRRVPRTLAMAAESLAEATGRDPVACAAVREVLNQGGELERDDGGRAFAFKLHQFIGQGRALFATLEPSDRREHSLEGQIQAIGGRIYAPVRFCVSAARTITTCSAPRLSSCLTLWAWRMIGISTRLAISCCPLPKWLERRSHPAGVARRRRRLSRTWRDRVPQPVWVLPDGHFWTQPHPGSIRMWWQARAIFFA